MATSPTVEETSEFGKGLTYCLGLFLAHEAMWRQEAESKVPGWPHYWFNGASDHLYELEVPESFPPAIKERLCALREKTIAWGHGVGERNSATEQDVSWSLKEAKSLLRAIDQFHGVDVVEGGWE